ncbi:MAG: YfhO family protein [Prevotella sp.]|nr:YfhO family protein [Prevotella sp.]
MKQLKSWLPDVLAVVFFAILAFAYFYPADVEDRVLNQGDISAGIGAGQEQIEYMNRTGERTRWTNALFSGMPTYQLSPSYDSTSTLSAVEKAYHLWLPDNVWYLFVYLLGFYILLRAFDFRQHLAALGSVVWAFSTYFLIIIAAGHLWKVMALAYLPPMIAGVVLAYRGKYLWGLVVTALFGALEIHANHVQMTYYYTFVIFLMVIAFMVDAIRQKRYQHLLKATLACIAGALLAVLVNASNLYHTWEYSKETMRGKSELVKENTSNQTDSGLERSYITDYSYGIGETWTLLIPNAKGGTSMHLLGETDAGKKEGTTHFINAGEGQRVPYAYFFNQMPQYWESSMEEGSNGTMGPVYVGAFVMMLFILGLLIVKGPIKWALLAATILSVMLAWGKNFMGLTDLFIDFMPMYAKFRAVESILVIAEFSIPLLAMLALRQVVDHSPLTIDHSAARSNKGQSSIFNLQSSIYIAFALTGGICLLFALLPSLFFDFYTTAEYAQFHQMLPAAEADAFLKSLAEVRQSVFTSDCWRSLIIIIIGTFLLLLICRAKKQKYVPVLALIALCLADLWMVNKRYLNDSMFKPRKERQQIRPMTEADRQILDDPSLDYRVLNLNGNVFNENETSYYHKSVGGYHAAKLRRYQDLIEHYISRQQGEARQAISTYYGDLSQVNGDSLWNVLNMLNTKYFLLVNPQEPQKSFSLQNPYAFGNAWMVDEVRYVANANEEIDALGELDLRRLAVADKQFEQVLGTSAPQDSTASVVLNAYEPNQLKYTVNSPKGGVVVFSEIYYPGWEATIDGQPATLGRANYVLRALKVAPGKHEVVLSFFPKTISTTEKIAYTALAVLGILVLALMVSRLRQRKE